MTTQPATCRCRTAPISPLWIWLTPRSRQTRITHATRRAQA